MTDPDPRTVTFLPLQEIKPDPRNPKSHHLETIDQSIGRFGMVDGIVRDDRTGYIISGHGRRKALEAMHERGETPPEGVKVSPTGEWLIPVLTGWASRTDSEAAAALIAMNRTTELGGWVDDELLAMLDDLSEIEDGFVGVGFNDGDIEDLRNHLSDLDSMATGPDLDAHADEWDGSGIRMNSDEDEDEGSSLGVAFTITLTNPELIDNWKAHQRGRSTDEALAELLLRAGG